VWVCGCNTPCLLSACVCVCMHMCIDWMRACSHVLGPIKIPGTNKPTQPSHSHLPPFLFPQPHTLNTQTPFSDPPPPKKKKQQTTTRLKRPEWAYVLVPIIFVITGSLTGFMVIPSMTPPVYRALQWGIFLRWVVVVVVVVIVCGGGGGWGGGGGFWGFPPPPPPPFMDRAPTIVRRALRWGEQTKA
jgi:hypothetical protein